MPEQTDFYSLLGISPYASDDEIRAAYRRAAQRWHPDVNKDPGASAMMQRVNMARDVLLNPVLRRRYEQEQGVSWANAPDETSSSRQETGYQPGQPQGRPRTRAQQWAEYRERERAQAEWARQEAQRRRNPGYTQWDRGDSQTWRRAQRPRRPRSRTDEWAAFRERERQQADRARREAERRRRAGSPWDDEIADDDFDFETVGASGGGFTPRRALFVLLGWTIAGLLAFAAYAQAARTYEVP